MAHFAVADDTQFTYVLTHAGKREEPETKIGNIVGDKEEIDFRLVKVLTQG